MLLGSYYGGICLAGASAGAIHALSYPLGGRYHVPHGVSNAMLFPHVMEFNFLGNLEKFARIAKMLGEEVDGLSLREAAEASVDAVRTLCEDVNIPTTLKELDIDAASAIPELAEAASLIHADPRFQPPPNDEGRYHPGLRTRRRIGATRPSPAAESLFEEIQTDAF